MRIRTWGDHTLSVTMVVEDRKFVSFYSQILDDSVYRFITYILMTIMLSCIIICNLQSIANSPHS